ncbi:MAG: beta-lactamase family protein, partial [Gemmatimonadaceae bacterium]|nr:beta-lactamase family protein [Gemmatimonadaceae bacterium]
MTSAPIIGAQPDAVRAAMAAALASHGLPGASWALVHPDRVDSGAAGVRDRRTGAPMGAGDRVQVGSVTKTITAVAVLRLVTLGRIGLD